MKASGLQPFSENCTSPLERRNLYYSQLTEYFERAACERPSCDWL